MKNKNAFKFPVMMLADGKISYEEIDAIELRFFNEVENQNSVAMREALNLANSIYRTEFKTDAPDWKPLDTIAGVISQIDNMYAGVREQRDCAKFILSQILAALPKNRDWLDPDLEIMARNCIENKKA